MKLKFKVSPYLKDKLSTVRVMRDLTLALCAVLVFALVFYGKEYGMNYATHILINLVVALATSFVTELVFAHVMKIKLIKQVKHSFPWVTPLILVLVMPVNTPIYAMLIASFIAVFFGKLVYGGLGQNIFNPAGIGRAVIALAFAGKVADDLSTSATPIGAINGYGWLLADKSVPLLIEEFGGWTGLLTGWHAGSIGETSFILIIILGIILIIRQAIDWRIPVFYMGTIFVLASIIGIYNGVGLWYPVYHVVTGGVAFAAVFMLTDPVTNPTHPYGRVLFAVGAAIFTVMLRVNSNMPGGVVFAILFMNMLTPMITRLLEGHQVKKLKTARIALVVLLGLGVGLSVLTATSVEAYEIPTSPVKELSITEEGNNVIYELSSPGFAKATPNEFKIIIDKSNDTIVSVVCTVYNDTPGYGDMATDPSNLANYEGIVVTDITETSVDAVSGATMTSNGIKDAVDYAINLYNQGGQ